MPSISRTTLAALVLLVAFLSLPSWLPGAIAGHPIIPVEPGTGAASIEKSDRLSGSWVPQQPASAPLLEELPAMTMVDAGWIRGGMTNQESIHPRAVLRWQPGSSAPEWSLETGHLWGVMADKSGRVYLMEHDQLTVVDNSSGAIRRRYEFAESPASGPQGGYPFPIDRIGRRLLVRNHAMYDNLFAFDLLTGRYLDQTWNVCEHAYPSESVYLRRENAVVTFCFAGYLTHLALDDGTARSLQIPSMGIEDYMVGNGFAIAQDRLVYVVDSDAGALVEIDLASMQIARQAIYRPQDQPASSIRQALAWLVDLAAAPARAKRRMSRPAISPDGRHLVVDGGFGIGGGATTTAWLIDLGTLAAIDRIDLPRSPEMFLFPNNRLVYILLETQARESAQVLVYDLQSRGSLVVDLPAPGYVTQLLP